MNEEKIMTLHPQGKKGVNILKQRYEPIVSHQPPKHPQQSVGRRKHPAYFNALFSNSLHQHSESDCFAITRNDDVGVTATRFRHSQ